MIRRIRSLLARITPLRALYHYYRRWALMRNKGATLLISTIPRSGTWYMRYFFHALDALAGGNKHPDLFALHDIVTAHSHKTLANLGIDNFLVDHYTCPGFHMLPESEKRQWQQLVNEMGATEFQEQLAPMLKWYAPQVNERSRICFIYRNPMDQYLSPARLYAERMAHVPTALRATAEDPLVTPQWPEVREVYRVQYDGDPYGFYMSKYQECRVLDAYIIQFLTFVEMRKRFPESILLVPFDEIQRDPEKQMQKIAQFAGVALDPQTLKQFITQACDITSKDKMKTFEEKLGHSLSARRSDLENEENNIRGQVRKNHITATPRPKWQDAFTRDDMVYVKVRLEAFGIALDDISLEFKETVNSRINERALRAV